MIAYARGYGVDIDRYRRVGKRIARSLTSQLVRAAASGAGGRSGGETAAPCVCVCVRRVALYCAAVAVVAVLVLGAGVPELSCGFMAGNNSTSCTRRTEVVSTEAPSA